MDSTIGWDSTGDFIDKEGRPVQGKAGQDRSSGHQDPCRAISPKTSLDLDRSSVHSDPCKAAIPGTILGMDIDYCMTL